MEEAAVEMRRSHVIAATVAACLLVSWAAPALYASPAPTQATLEPTAVGDLVAKAKAMDGQQVRLVGEAVGDRMIRGDFAWINVLDRSGTAIGVYLPKDQALKVRNMGAYSGTGDVVDVTGTFHNACLLHDGEPDVHSDVIAVIEQGVPVYHPVDTRRAVLSALLLALAGLTGLAVRRRSSRSAR
jgi:hypothetical protein